MSGGRATTAVLVSILLGAALLRFLGLDNGLPHVVGVDEGFEVHRALRLGAGEFDLQRDAKGGFFYLLFLGYGIYFVGLFLLGRVDSPTEFAQSFVADLTPFFMIGRVTHALISVLAVYWTYRIGRRMYGERAGLFGAAVVAVSLLHVAQSHYVGVDLPMVLLVLVTLELAHGWSDARYPARPALLGVVFGFTVMHKIIGIAVLVPIALANWLRHRRHSLVRRLFARELLLAYVVAALVFMIGNPAFVLHLGTFFDGALEALTGATATGVAAGGATLEAPNLWLYYLEVLSDDLGFALLVFALAGGALAAVRRRPADLLLLATAGAFYLLIAGARTTQFYFPRYALPLIPPLGLLAGRLLDRVVGQLPMGERWRGWATAGIAIVLLLPAGLQSGAWSRLQTRGDSRVAARSWFESHAESGAAVFVVGNPLVDTAPNLSLPLSNTDANLDALIAEIRDAEPTKAQMLEWRKKAALGVRFDLRTVRHFEPNGSLDEYLTQGVRYFVLDAHHFGDARLARDRKHAADVLASRARLAEACRSDPRVELAFSIDPATARLTGPAIDVFRVVDAGAS